MLVCKAEYDQDPDEDKNSQEFLDVGCDGGV